MRRPIMLAAAVLVVGLALAACGEDEPGRTVQQGDVLLTQSFDQPGAWEEGTFPPDAETPQSTLAIEEGRYVINHEATRGSSFTWGAGGPEAQDVIVEVQAEQLSAENDNLYGVGCRLVTDEDGNVSGYVLLISGDGHYSIAELSRGSLDFLLEWHQTDAIHQGQAANTLRAACVDNYLTVSVNGEFLGEVTNDAYVRPGQVALVAGVTEGARVRIAFDNLTVYKAALE